VFGGLADSAISNKCQGSINVDATIYPNKVKSGILRTGRLTALATGLTSRASIWRLM
jgi:hypothetical protein